MTSTEKKITQVIVVDSPATLQKLMTQAPPTLDPNATTKAFVWEANFNLYRSNRGMHKGMNRLNRKLTRLRLEHEKLQAEFKRVCRERDKLKFELLAVTTVKDTLK